MDFTEVTNEHDISALIAEAYQGATKKGDYYYGVLRNFTQKVEEVLKLIVSVDGDTPITDKDSQPVILDIANALQTAPLTIESLSIKVKGDPISNVVKEGLLSADFMAGDTPFTMLANVNNILDDGLWCLKSDTPAISLTTRDKTGILYLEKYGPSGLRMDQLKGINSIFPANAQAIHYAPHEALKDKPFNRLATGSLQNKAMSDEDKLHALMDLAIRANSHPLAWDLLETGLCDERTLRLALKNVFLFREPRLTLDLIKQCYSGSLLDLYEFGLMDLRKFSPHYMTHAERSKQAFEALPEYFDKRAPEASARVLDRAAKAFKIDEDIRVELMCSYLHTTSEKRQRRSKL